MKSSKDNLMFNAQNACRYTLQQRWATPGLKDTKIYCTCGEENAGPKKFEGIFHTRNVVLVTVGSWLGKEGRESIMSIRGPHEILIPNTCVCASVSVSAAFLDEKG